MKFHQAWGQLRPTIMLYLPYRLKDSRAVDSKSIKMKK